MKNVISSAAQLEVGALLHKNKAGELIIVTLYYMVFPYQATHMDTENSTTHGIVNDTTHKMDQIHGHAVLLGTMSNPSGRLQRVLETSRK